MTVPTDSRRWDGGNASRIEALEAEVERLHVVLKGIAESSESRDALQVWAWNAIKDSELMVLADDPQNPHNQVPDFSKGKS